MPLSLPVANSQLSVPENTTTLKAATSDTEFLALKKEQFRRDWRASEKWRQKAKGWYEMRDGKQWDDATVAALDKEDRPHLTFGRIKPVLNVVCGVEISNRQEINVFPRQEGDAVISDLGTEGLKWIDDRCQAETEESRAFLDLLTCGIGVTETRIDYLDDPDGKTYRERVCPLHVAWDASSSKRNMTDSRRTWRMKVMEKDEAMSLYPDADPFELDADWTGLAADSMVEQTDDSIKDYRKDNHTTLHDMVKPVRLVQVQWWERGFRYQVTGPDGQTQQIDKEEARKYTGIEGYRVRKVPFKHYKFAIIGKTILAQGDLDPGDRFHFQFMTGDFNETEQYWQGLVEPMVAPQQGMNKTLSNIIDLLSKMRKGGFLYEADFFVDEEQAKRDLNKPNPAIPVNRGALSNATGGSKYQELSVGTLPQQLGELLEFMKTAIHEGAGVPVELLSQQESDQLSGIQEYERRRAGITMLAGYFDSLRLYRIQQASLSFDFLRAFHEGALIRLLQTNEEGDETEQYVPMILDEQTEEFDFVIDDSPTAPNQKERTWQLLTPLLPIFVQVGAPPEMLEEILRASPLPKRVVERIIGSSEPTEEEQEDQQMLREQKKVQLQSAIAMLHKLASETEENKAQTKKYMAGANLDTAKARDLGYRAQLDTMDKLNEMDVQRNTPDDQKSVIDHQ